MLLYSTCQLLHTMYNYDYCHSLTSYPCLMTSSLTVLTYRYVLTDIYNMVDTDMNGLLSRDEFSMYSMRTGEEEVGDDEWNVVKGKLSRTQPPAVT